MPSRSSKELRELFASSPFSLDTGLTLRSATKGRSRVALKAERRHTQGLSRVHGGIVAALADTAATWAAYSAIGGGEHLLTISFSLNMTSSSRAGDTLLAEARVIHAGRRTMVAHTEVFSPGRRLVASGTFTMVRERDGDGGPVRSAAARSRRTPGARRPGR